MPWLLTSPGHQQPWCCTSRIKIEMSVPSQCRGMIEIQLYVKLCHLKISRLTYFSPDPVYRDITGDSNIFTNENLSKFRSPMVHSFMHLFLGFSWWLLEKCCARSRYQGQGQVIISHRYSVMWWFVPALGNCFPHNTPEFVLILTLCTEFTCTQNIK